MVELGDVAAQLGEQIAQFLDTIIWGSITVWAVLLSIVILVAGVVVIRFLAKAVRAILRRLDFPPLVRNFLVRVFRFLLYVILLGLILAPLGIDLTSLVISFGVLGIVIGFALRDFLSNLIAGITLILVRPFRKGHVVEAAGVTGFVEDVSINATTLKTFDGKKVVLSSSQVWGNPIVNYHHWPIRRVDLVVGVSYEDDIPRALKVIGGVLESDERILKEPEATTNVNTFADSSINLNIFAWAKQEDWGNVRTDLLLSVKKAFETEGITIPYPTRTVVLRGDEEGARS